MQYVIGIGANLGFTLENIHTAIKYLDQHQDIKILKKAKLYSSDALLKEEAPEDWNIKFINTAVKINSSLNPKELLQELKKVEEKIGRDLNAPVWSPRLIDLDILSAEDHSVETDDLKIPHIGLVHRSFALAPLLDIDKTWHHPQHADSDLSIRLKELESVDQLNQRLSNTLRMGIVNLSDQSFTDGHLNDDERKSNLFDLIEDGAEIIDIGAESTKPNATAVCINEEVQKLNNFLNYLKSNLKTLTRVSSF